MDDDLIFLQVKIVNLCLTSENYYIKLKQRVKILF